MKIIKLVGALLVTVWISTAQAALILDIDVNGNLMGAQNVLVDGSYYDVEFVDGTCAVLFSGCDEDSDFIFDSAIAEIAMLALLDDVFIDTTLGDFGSTPALINGCSQVSLCQVIVPVIREGDNLVGFNDLIYNDRPNFLQSLFIPADLDLGSNNTATWARWSAAAPPTGVPEPSTLAIFALGMIGLASRRFKKQS